ncbi:MAG TPA: CoA-binding protein [Dehalococcoidia bacterium]|nr:CoA-binding protein [Dehalococcoidia bacterium]
MADIHPLDYIFRPRSVAVVGVSGKARDWGGGNMFLAGLQKFGFPGPLYPINPNVEEVLGLRCYPSLSAVEGPVDHVISSIPATGVLPLMDDAAAKGVHSVHFFTAGFRETGEPDRIDLERQVQAKAKAAGIRLIGPNCMGLYCPSSGVTFGGDFPKEPGGVAFISQSGLNGEDLVHSAMLRGLRFSKVISYGNATDLDESDFFEYCTVDPETEIILAYIEGVKDGRRFQRALRAASAAKPVVILKGGLTEAGDRATRSHTGSLAGSPQIWEALCRQAGVVSVETLEDLVDMAATFRFLKPPAGRGTAIIVVGGGSSVLAADMAERLGLKIPPLSEDIQAQLRPFTPLAGTSIRNPLDTVALEDKDGLYKTVKIVGESPDIQSILILPRLDWWLDRAPDVDAMVRATAEKIKEAAEASPVPLALALRVPENAKIMEAFERFYEQCAAADLPVYPDFERALASISRFVGWHEARERVKAT